MTGGMRFAIDGWDPGYGSTFEVDEDLAASSADIDPAVELAADEWRPIPPPGPMPLPNRILFVDGVRRVEARAWIENAAVNDASMAICASYAAGVVCCDGRRAQLQQPRVERGLFTVTPDARPVVTTAGTYAACPADPTPAAPLFTTLSQALQRRLADLEARVADTARAEASDGSDLLVIDGPLHGRTSIPRSIGYIKSHQSAYLPRELHALVGRLAPGERTPAFRVGTSWDRHTWYLRLPGLPGAPWAGVVRVECSPTMDREHVIALANLTQAVLPRYASAEYKDTRAPQNLYPIAGLERELRRRLGDQRLLYRALRAAAAA